MAGRSSASEDDAIYGINVTPLVDIMLVLLIIFMVAARLEDGQAVGVELPKAATGAEAPPATLAIVVPRHGPVKLDGQATTMEQLAAKVREAAGRSADAQAVVSADRQVPYERVVEVVDVVRSGGIRKLALSVEPK
jgi:biopolymer transport protein ExbD